MFKLFPYRILLLVGICLHGSMANAQYLPIQDAALAKALCKQWPAILDNSCKKLDTALAMKYSRNTLYFSRNGIRNADELMYLKWVDTLDVHSNDLRSLPTIKAGSVWKNIDFSNNELSTFPNLAPLSKTLEILDLSDNVLKEIKGLEQLPNLKRLDLSNNKLRSLPELNTSARLDKVNVADNYLSFSSLIPLANRLEWEYWKESSFGNQRLLTSDTTLSLSSNYPATLQIPIDEGVDGLTYVWYKGGEIFKKTSTNKLIFNTIQKSDSGEYWVSITSNHPKLQNVSVNSGKLIVEVQDCQKLLSYEFSKNVMCDNSSISLSSISLSNPNPSFTIAVENEGKQQTIVTKGLQFSVTNGEYALVISDKNCLIRKEKALILTAPQSCPSILSPNGDGIEDLLYLIGQNEAQIINKEGVVVKNISLPNYWDGTNNQGEPVLIGSYLILRKDGSSEKVTVVR